MSLLRAGCAAVGAAQPAADILLGDVWLCSGQSNMEFNVAQSRGGAIAAARLRFCWGDSPLCNLSDGTGLPVGSFEIPIR